MSKVSVVSCAEYEYSQIKDSVYSAVNLLGGADKFIKPGAKVLVKPNLLRKCTPNENITTHPLVVRAVLELISDMGAKALIAESPGGLYTRSMFESIYKISGMAEAAKYTGAELNYNTDIKDVFLENGKQIKNLTVIAPLLETDCVINSAKLKTHEMMVYTGAVKNLFGLVPGVTKAEYHLRVPDNIPFANMLVDICEFAKPVLNIIDAVYGMEGEGPAAGVSRKIGAIIASDSAYAADLAALRIVNISPHDVYTMQCAFERNLISGEASDIEFLGESIESLKITDFKLPTKLTAGLLEKRTPKFMKGFVNKRLKLYPKIPAKKCIGCGVCKNNCPAKAIIIENKVAIIDYKECINCYCCHELCPEKIIKIKKPALLKLINKFLK